MLLTKNHKVIRILNNSSIIVQDTFNELVLLGRGIGFGLKPGDILPKGSEYDKSYKLLTQTNEFHRIINGYDGNIVTMVMETIRQIIKHDTGSFDTKEMVALADHLAAMFRRIATGTQIVSYFTQETQALYPMSYQHALEIAELVNSTYNVTIPSGELAYIAIYIQNLQYQDSKHVVSKLNAIVSEIDLLLTDKNHLDIDKNSVAYSRMLTHIRFIVEAATSNKKMLTADVNDTILKAYPVYTELAKEISKIIESEMDITLDDKELIYFVIHLANLIES